MSVPANLIILIVWLAVQHVKLVLVRRAYAHEHWIHSLKAVIALKVTLILAYNYVNVNYLSYIRMRRNLCNMYKSSNNLLVLRLRFKQDIELIYKLLWMHFWILWQWQWSLLCVPLYLSIMLRSIIQRLHVLSRFYLNQKNKYYFILYMCRLIFWWFLK